MKRIRFILITFLLLAFAPYVKGQEKQLIMVHKNGNISYASNLTTSDSIAFSKFNVPHTSSGVLINGVLWATCNVNSPGTFASSPSESGMFYQWNRRIGWSSTNPMINHEGGTDWDSSTPTGDTWEAANDPCPAGWRVPTLSEQQSLLASGSFWGELNGVSGRFFGNSDQRVFFPAAGYRDYSGGSLSTVGSNGYYWSSTPNGSEYACNLGFQSGYAYMADNWRSYGFSVRCVSE